MIFFKAKVLPKNMNLLSLFCISRFTRLLPFTLFLFASYAISSSYNLPQVTVSKALTKYEIEKNEWTTVKIVVKGDTRIQTQSFPTAVVLAIDYSGSMAKDDAYKDASAAAEAVLNLLSPGLDKLGIITIRSNASWVVPLTTLTATNILSIKQTISSLNPDGYTNLKDAFDLANSVLETDPSSNKVVILMSDGYPTSANYPLDHFDYIQQNYIFNNRYFPSDLGIRYCTIGFGMNPNQSLLKPMADATGGIYQSATTKSDLVLTFKKALDERNSLTVSHLDITESVSKNLKIRPGSLSWSGAPIGNDPVVFDHVMQNAKNTLHQTNFLTVPTINLLPINHNFTFTFDVTVESCGEEVISYYVDEPFPSSKVEYISGGVKSQIPVGQAQLNVKPCDVHLEKEFDLSTQTVTLSVRNDYPRSITQVLVLEVTSIYFVPELPIYPSYDIFNQNHRQIRWGDISNNKISLSSSELRKFSFKLGTTDAAMDKSGPLDIDFERSGVTYTVDLRYFDIEANEAGFNDFEKDLRNLKVSAQTSIWLTTWFANKPDPYRKGQNLGWKFTIPVGARIYPIKHLAGTQPSEFGWIINAGSSPIKIKKTVNNICVYSPTTRSKLFPQVQTPPGFP